MHRRHLDQCILHRWIAEVVLLLQKMDSLHGCQRIGRQPTLGAGLGIKWLNQINQLFPGYHFLHLSQNVLASGALLSRGLLVIAISGLLAAHEPNPRLQLQGHSRADVLGFPGLPDLACCAKLRSHAMFR